MSSYENRIVDILNKEHIKFIREKTFSDLRKGLFRYDFFIDDPIHGTVIIEVDGQYHFHPIRGRIELNKQKEYDRRKNSYCLAKGIALYRIPYWDIYNIKSWKDITQDKYRVKTMWHNDKLTPK